MLKNYQTDIARWNRPENTAHGANCKPETHNTRRSIRVRLLGCTSVGPDPTAATRHCVNLDEVRSQVRHMQKRPARLHRKEGTPNSTVSCRAGSSGSIRGGYRHLGKQFFLTSPTPRGRCVWALWAPAASSSHRHSVIALLHGVFSDALRMCWLGGARRRGRAPAGGRGQAQARGRREGELRRAGAEAVP